MLAKEKRIYELSQVDGMPSCVSYQIPFRHLCNLLQINSGDIDAVLASLPDLLPDQVDRLKTRAACAWYWITECAPEDFRFALVANGICAELSTAEKAAVVTIRDSVLPAMDVLDEKALSERLYAVANDAGLDPKDLFTAVYRALVGKERGPRLASFMKVIGPERLSAILSGY